jgi:sporulation protein YqfC
LNTQQKGFGKFNFFGNPVKFATESAHMEINGNREVRIEGCRKILEYNKNKIRILTKSTSISFNGRNLKINCLTSDSLLIEGFIKSIEFIN